MILEAVTLAQILKPKEPLPQPKPVQTVQVELKPISTHVEHGIKKEKKHIVKRGETLTTIAKKNKTSWQRIFYKNKSIKNPDDIKPGQRIVIPSKLERLKKRAIRQVEPKQAKQTIKSGSYANDMTPGYCTHWAKSQRPDLPTGLGNANTWYSRARDMGLSVGSTPKVGAVATTTRGAEGHVSIVEKVKGNMIYVSEMNVQGWNVLSYAWYPASDYLYVY
jgi:surface antigen